MQNKWNSPVVGCTWFVALWFNANLFVFKKKSCLTSLNNRLCGMKWGCVASLELLRHLQAKISFQSDWSHMWRRNNVLEAANEELLGIKKKKVHCGCSDRSKWSWINNGTQFMFCSLAPSRSNVLSFPVSRFYDDDGSKISSFQKVLLKRSTPP